MARATRKQILEFRKHGKEIAAEAAKAKLTRRELVKLGLIGAGGAAMMAALPERIARAQSVMDDTLTTTVPIPQSPPHTPWVDPFRRMPVADPIASTLVDGCSALGLDPNPANWTTLIDGGTNPVAHQRIAKWQPQKFYHHEVREFQHLFSSSWGTSTMWGFGDVRQPDITTTPGMVIRAKYGEPILRRLTNRLPMDHVGFGVPEHTIHLHNSHTPSESDGNPVDYVITDQDKDHYYPNIYAGNDTREMMSTLWYHDHHLDHTAENVYAGLAGQYILSDHQDTGDETTGLHLPSGEYDIPMLVGDVSVDESFQPVFDLFNLDGILGDCQPVNGVIQPVLEVAKRRYRFRIQIAGPSRWFHIALWDGSKYLPFWQISTDGNLLPQAIPTSGIRLGVAQRVDIVVDFGKMTGSRFYLVNRAEQINGRGPTGKLLTPGTGLVQMNVGAAAPDYSLDLGNAASPGAQSTWKKLIPLPDTDWTALNNLAAQATQRTWTFDRTQGAWTVNGQFFNPDKVSAMITQQASAWDDSPKATNNKYNECWTIKNGGGSWLHPVHIHFEEHRTLSRNGVKPPIADIARKDVIDLSPSETVKVFFRMRDFKHRYVMHCHNVVHEDHAMMIRWDIV